MVETGVLATFEVVLETAEPLGAGGFIPVVEGAAAPEVTPEVLSVFKLSGMMGAILSKLLKFEMMEGEKKLCERSRVRERVRQNAS